MLAAIVKFFLTRRAVIVAVGLSSGLVVSAFVPTSLASRLVIAAAFGVMYLSLAGLLAKEVLRQDLLRERVAHQGQRQAGGEAPPSAPVAPGARSRSQGSDSRQPDPARQRDRGSPLVSLVVTAHNEQRFLRQALESVRAQTWTAWECIVIDDASTDDSMRIASNVAREDDRFRVLHLEKNVGLAGARNIGLARTKGQFVTFLDADDLMYKHAIEARVSALLQTSDEEWVAGTYVKWHPIPEDGGFVTTPRGGRTRHRVTWLDSVFDAPFIASAPLVRVPVLRELGGFDIEARTAEDFDLWSRLLRSGYVIDAVNTVGIAYRQKQNSLYRRTSREHAERTKGTYRAALEATPMQGRGPFLLTDPYYEYEAQVAAFRRSVTGFVTAVAADDADAMAALSPGLEVDDAPYLLRFLDVEQAVHSTALRLERWSEDALKARVSALEKKVWDELGPLLGYVPGQRSPSSSTPSAHPEVSVAQPDVRVRDVTAGVAALPVMSGDDVRLFLMPESAYHVDELGPVADLAAAAGAAPAFLVSDARYDSVANELRKYRVPVFQYSKDDPPTDAVVRRASGIVTMNDWGPARHLVEACNAAGVPTFGKVEGVQDFKDDDVHWDRGAYTRVGTVLCQGENDVAATTGERVIVGSTRLERIWEEPEIRAPEPLAVINVNFTYGVLADAREGWLTGAIAACENVGIPFILSAHPAERSKLPTEHVAEQPIRHMLTRASVLISRFSTVPFEAMARGVPFIYHNPHGERVPTFQNPDGAFLISRDVTTLEAALVETSTWQPGYRQRAARFFRSQVDITEQSSEERTWELLAARLKVRPPMPL